VAVPEWGGARSSVTIVRSVFLLIGAVAFWLGWVGMHEYCGWQKGCERQAGSDVFYFVLQLYVLGSDALQQGGPFPWQLEAARLLAPLFLLLTVVETGRSLMATEVRQLRSRIARRHAVVCGDTPFAQALAKQLFVTGQQVVVVRAAAFGPLELRHRRMLGVSGDARSAAVLRAAGIRRARYVYVCGDDDEFNHAVAVAAGTELQLRRTSPWIYVQVNRQQTCT
jgi:voltage-gated potassium channel Kch